MKVQALINALVEFNPDAEVQVMTYGIQPTALSSISQGLNGEARLHFSARDAALPIPVASGGRSPGRPFMVGDMVRLSADIRPKWAGGLRARVLKVNPTTLLIQFIDPIPRGEDARFRVRPTALTLLEQVNS